MKYKPLKLAIDTKEGFFSDWASQDQWSEFGV